jgi:hypothetical protein
MLHYDLEVPKQDANKHSEKIAAKALKKKRAREAVPEIATTLKQPVETLLNCFMQIAYDPFTTFYAQTWINPDKPAIGILTYGFIDDEVGDEIKKLVIRMVSVGVKTPYKAEFGHSSHARVGAPVLVPVDRGGAHVPARILVLDERVDLETARELLLERETRVVEGLPPEGIVLRHRLEIVEQRNFHGVPLLLYVKIVPSIYPITGARLAELSLASVRHFKENDLADGISYLIDARRCNIKTPRIKAYTKAVLKATKAKTLEEARRLARKHM